MSFVHAQTFAVQLKFSLPVPLGQPQFTVVQPLVTLPHALPIPAVGQVAGAQQTCGLTAVLHAMPPAQVQFTVPPQWLSKVPQASPPWPGPPGTVEHV